MHMPRFPFIMLVIAAAFGGCDSQCDPADAESDCYQGEVLPGTTEVVYWINTTRPQTSVNYTAPFEYRDCQLDLFGCGLEPRIVLDSLRMPWNHSSRVYRGSTVDLDLWCTDSETHFLEAGINGPDGHELESVVVSAWDCGDGDVRNRVSISATAPTQPIK